MDNKIKVLIVDDAAFMRKTIRKILESDKRFTVVGVAKNGQEAIKLNNEVAPDVVTLDIDMPVMDGITALKHMMVQRPVPVVVVSSLSYETSVTFEAFRLGVVDFIPKPTGAVSQELEKQKNYLCEMAAQAAAVEPLRLRRVPFALDVSEKYLPPVPANKVVIVGSSLGGPAPLMRFLSQLPASIDFAVVAITHISPKVMDSFVVRLDKVCEIKVGRGRSGSLLCHAHAYLHTLEPPWPQLRQQDGNYILDYYQPQPNALPIDNLMISACTQAGLKTGAVLLSGNGKDGVEGIRAVARQQGGAWVQLPATAMFPGKPQLAVEQGLGEMVNDVDMAGKIASSCKEKT